jgi:uncharacterized membrane protein
MGHETTGPTGHAHDHRIEVEPGLARALNLAVVGLAVLTLVGLAVLWPRGEVDDGRQQGVQLSFWNARVLSVDRTVCRATELDTPTECQQARVELSEGPDAGRVVGVWLLDTEVRQPRLEAGDRIVVVDNPGVIPEYRYGFAEYQRRAPLALLAALFVAVVVAVGRWRGVRALVGLVFGVGVLLVFTLPSLLRLNNGLVVALVTAALVGSAVLYLAHGISTTTTVAFLGTMTALVLTALLALSFVQLANLTGLVDEADQILAITAAGVSLPGLVVAGTVIGALGVLDDVTVTQVSAVGELHRANPTLGRVELYRRAMRIGRDHIASTVNTLVLAYAGASLPLLLVFFQGPRPFGRVLTSEAIATEIVRTLVGSIGLVLAVPVTTGLAALVVGSAVRAPEPTGPPRWEDFAPEET